MAPRPLPQSWSSPSPLQWHLAMAPSNGTTSTPPKLVALPPPATMAPCNGTTSTPPKLVVTLPFPHHSTLQWHPAMAPRPLPQSWSSPSPTIAHYNGSPWMAPRPLHPEMAPWCHVQSAKVVRRPHPLLEVRTPIIAIAIWGKNKDPPAKKGRVIFQHLHPQNSSSNL